MLKEEFLKPLKQRNIVLFPDLGLDKSKKGSPFRQWTGKYKFLKGKGYKIKVSKLLEDFSSAEEKQNGFDLADFVSKDMKF